MMPKITKIEVQKNNSERFNLYLDGVFEMGVDINTLVYFNLKKDQQVEPTEMAEIQQYEQYRQGINRAINYISYRKRTDKEVAQHLAKADINEQTIARVLEYCHEQKLIDHDDYAESLKNTMLRTSDKGPETYRQKLFQAGIENDVIERYVDLYESEQPFEQILHVAQKIIKQKKGTPMQIKSKVSQSLMQKGFTMGTINEVMSELNFSQSEDTLDEMLQQDLEKAYRKYDKKYEGRQVIQKTIETLMRKGYKYDKIKIKLKESGLEDGTETFE